MEVGSGSESKLSGFKAMVRLNQQEYVNWTRNSAILVFIHGVDEVVYSQTVRYHSGPGRSTDLQVAFVGSLAASLVADRSETTGRSVWKMR